MASGFDRTIGLSAGLLGAAGVALSAAGAHAAPGANLDTAGWMALLHAAALLGLATPRAGSAALRRLAALVMVVGVLLFSGDLALRAFQGRHLFPMAAPSGGFALMAAWLLAGLSVLGRGDGPVSSGR